MLEEKLTNIKLTPTTGNIKDFEENVTELLEPEEFAYNTMIPTGIPENKIEVVSSSEVTHMFSDKTNDVTASMKVDTLHPIIADMPVAQESETPLQIKESQKVLIKPLLSENESLIVTETDVSNTVDEYQVDKLKPLIQANESFVPTESFMTTETEAHISVSNLEKDEKHFESAKPAMTLSDAINVSEQYTSVNEEPLDSIVPKESNASVTFTPLLSINVLEVNEKIKEGEVMRTKSEKEAKPKLNFNLHESIQVGEVFVEDKSGKYYPELIVPTESARKDVLVSNQVVTEVHDVQECEGSLSALKLPPLQEAHVDFTSKDSLVVSIGDLHEKEAELSLKDLPSEVKPEGELVVHSSLTNTVTTAHLKESEFTPENVLSKKATIGINELQHKFNTETNVNESEATFDDVKTALSSRAGISIFALDKNTTEEVNVHESEKDLIIKDEKYTATADVDVKAIEHLTTSEIVQMTSTGDIKLQDLYAADKATETIITSKAKMVSTTITHDKEGVEEFLVKKPEEITTSLIPNTSISVSETETSECEQKLQLHKTPELMKAQQSPSHHLKTPLSEEVNTTEQTDSLQMPKNLTETASEQRDLQKEITVLQTNVEEQLQQLSEKEPSHSTANTSFIGQEYLNVTETVPSYAEKELDADLPKQSSFATVDINSGHKAAIISEVSTGDALSKLESLKPHYDEAHIASNNLNYLKIEENKIYDSQSVLESDIKPDLKSITPKLIPLEDTVSVMEVVQNEKESQYEKATSPESVKASVDVVGRPVAVLSEVTVDSSVGYTENIGSDYSKKAHVENVLFKELIITTTDYNEKESSIEEKSGPNTALATFNVDSNQAIIVEEQSSVIESEPMISNKTQHLKANAGAIISEAVSQQEVFIHSSEDILAIQTSDHEEKPTVSYTGLQAPEYDQNIIVESEDTFNKSLVPDEQTAVLSVTGHCSIETTEILPQSDNLMDTEKIEVNFKQALTKIDDIYGKTAHTEEVITNQTTELLKKDDFPLQNSNITSVANTTFEQLEVITAEKESSIVEQLPMSLCSQVTQNFTEIETVVTSCVESIDKEKSFDKSIDVPQYDAVIAFVPLNSTIDTEVVTTGTVDTFDENPVKGSVASVTQDELKKHLQGFEVLHNEKETNLDDLKTDLRNASSEIVETSAKEITEIHAIENENIFQKTSEINALQARPMINEQQSLFETEVIVNQDAQELKVSETSVSTAIKTHGIQEAVSKSEPFIGEVENVFTSETPTQKRSQPNIEEQKSVGITEVVINESETSFAEKPVLVTETLVPSLQSQNYVSVTEVLSSEKEHNLKTKDFYSESKQIEPRADMLIKTSINIAETVVGEGEEALYNEEHKPVSLSLSMHPVDHINVSENVLAEREEELSKTHIAKAVTGDISVNTLKHINIEICETSENENIFSSIDTAKREISEFSIESNKPLQITNIETEETHEDLLSTRNIKTLTPSFEFEVGEHIMVTEVDLHEKESDIGAQKAEPSRQSELFFETNIPLQVEEVLFRESETHLVQELIPSQETSGITFDSQRHVTVTNTEFREKEGQFIPENIYHTNSKQILDSNSNAHITTMETITMEGLKELDDRMAKDETASSKPITLMEIMGSQPEIIESLSQFQTKYEPAQGTVQPELELHKSYTTSENTVHEVSEQIMSHDVEHKVAHECISEMKSVQQTEVILGENSETLDNFITNKKDKAIKSHIALQELSNTKTQILENVIELPKSLEVEMNTASVNLETLKSYIVTDDLVHETPNEIIITETSETKQICHQIMELNPIEQTEIIVGENYTDIIKAPKHDEKSIHPTPIEMQPVSQSDVFIQEKEVDTTFDKPKQKENANVILSTTEGITVQEIVQEDSQDYFTPTSGKPVKAEQTISQLSHLQCSENVPETHTDVLKTPTVQTETTKITQTSITPLIITDREILQHETELLIQEPKTKQLKKGMNITNEIKITKEFVDEQILPYSEKTPEYLTGTVKEAGEQAESTVFKPEVHFKGKNCLLVPIA